MSEEAVNNTTNTAHTENVLNTLKYSVEQFDKNILFISSGALGGSFAFIKDLVPNLKEAREIHYLIESWYCFASIIFVSLISHFISMKAHKWAVTNSNLSDDLFNAKIKCWNVPITILNISTIIATLIGAILLISFVQKNTY